MKDNRFNTSKIVWTVLFLFFIFIILLKCFSNGFFFGYRTTFVLSESMVPEIPVASLLIEKKYEKYDTLEVGDVITFLVDKTEKPIRVTHRIVQINDEWILTKGDANSEIDPWVILKENVEGKLVFVYPFFFQTVSILAFIFFNTIHFIKRKENKI